MEVLSLRRLREREAVSPVIAVILLVAITVVLTAVLYMMVTGFLMTPGSVPPHGKFTRYDRINTTSDEIFFGEFVPQTNFFEFKVRMYYDSVVEDYLWSDSLDTFYKTGGNVTIQVIDLGGEGKVSRGDSLVLGGLVENKDYILKLVHLQSGGVVADFDWHR